MSLLILLLNFLSIDAAAKYKVFKFNLNNSHGNQYLSKVVKTFSHEKHQPNQHLSVQNLESLLSPFLAENCLIVLDSFGENAINAALPSPVVQRNIAPVIVQESRCRYRTCRKFWALAPKLPPSIPEGIDLDELCLGTTGKQLNSRGMRQHICLQANPF